MSQENVEAAEAGVAAVNRGDLATLLEPIAWLHTFRAGTGPGKYVRLQVFATRAQALDAAGVQE